MRPDRAEVTDHATAFFELEALIESCREGTFYEDYDDSTFKLGRAQAAVDFFRRTHGFG